MRRVVFLLVILVGAAGWGEPAPADTVPYRQYVTHDGLPSKRITALAQTNDGLLWVGTQHGLVVYDGHEFRSIPMPDSIDTKNVLALQPMPDGSVWAGVGSDVVRVAPHGVVESYLLDHHHVVEILRREGRLRFVTHLAVWEQGPNDEELTRTPFRYETLQDVTHVGGADLGPEGTLWILNGARGPGRIQSDGTVAFADPPPAPPSDYERRGEFFDLRFGADGTALVARGMYLYRFDPETGAFTVVEKVGDGIDEVHRQGQTAYLPWKETVLRYDTRTRRFLKPIGATQDLPSATTTDVLRSRGGGLWVGTQGAGLLHFPAPEVRHVTSIDGHDIQYGAALYQEGGRLWVSTWGDGLFQLRPQRKKVSPGGHTRWVFLRSHDDKLHGLTATGTARGRKWYRWTPEEGWTFVAFAKRAVRGYVDTSGVGYFWHNKGLYRHVPTGDTTEYTRIRSWPLNESQHHLMGPAPNGDLIVFDQGTVLRLRRPDGAVIDTVAQVPAHATSGGRRLQVDGRGRVWCPFSSLLRIDPHNETTQTMLKKAVLESVEVAGDSLAMVKTDEGLYLLNANTGTVRRHLTVTDGLLSNDINGTHLTEDTLYVGHPSGLTVMPTDSLFGAPQTPHAVLTGTEINLEDHDLPADSVLGKDERSVGFSYTGASLAHADRVQYEVRLMPRDTTWKSTSRRFARYTNLDPGTYRFEVRARLAGQPPGPVASHTITIPPRFYETGWFQALAGLFVLSLVVGGYRWRVYLLRQRQEALRMAVEERTRQLQARTEELAEEKRKTEAQAERLAELDEAKNRFFAHVSHEFRTPLSLILSPLRDALQRAAGSSVRFGERQVRRMTRNAERLQRLIDQLLDLATLEAGEMRLERRPGDVVSLVRRTAEAFRSRAEQKEVRLQVETPEGRIAALFDPEKLETIISNLVGNAIKFTPDRGAVAVRVVTDEPSGSVEAPGDGEAVGSVRIEVEDTGPGIPPEVQETIFDRFGQADRSSTREHEGTGLGLALTRELAELHGGDVSVESEPGEGSRFTVRLPLVPVGACGDGAREGDGLPANPIEVTEHPGMDPGGVVLSGTAVNDGAGGCEEATAEGTASDEASTETATILVVEDNAEMRAYLREELSGRWQVIEAADGEAGWAAVREQEPALVVSDVMMPKADGTELCRRIKAEEALRAIPVLLLTARAGEEATLEGLEAGADDYVEKPFGPEELRRRIANHLSARRHLEARYREEVSIEALGAVVESEEQPFVERVMEAAGGRLSNPDFGVGDLAEEMALSRRQLTRRLKRAVGEPPGQVLRRLRIERGKRLLREGAETVSEVAYATGFRSPSAFSHAFGEVVGRTPTEFIEECAEKQPEGERDV